MPLLSIIILFFNVTPTNEIYTLSLHDALPICIWLNPSILRSGARRSCETEYANASSSVFAAELLAANTRSEEHTSELQSLRHLVCRLVLEKKNMRDIPSTDVHAKTAERHMSLQ